MKTFEYKGYRITYKAGYYWALTKPFMTLVAATEFIDNLE